MILKTPGPQIDFPLADQNLQTVRAYRENSKTPVSRTNSNLEPINLLIKQAKKHLRIQC